MRESYRNYVRHNTASYKTLFAHLLDDTAPLVIHCTAGKDRTGFASALILKALGVSDESGRRRLPAHQPLLSARRERH